MDEKKSALVIASSRYEDALLRQLVAPAQDATALAGVLGNPTIGGFEVKQLIDEPSYKVAQAIEEFFSGRRRDDLLVLYFSGHGIKDEDGLLYLATVDTRRNLLRSSAVAASFINEVMGRSMSRRQVLFLDCCHSGAFARGMVAKGDTSIGTREQFEGRGRVVLTASDAMQYSFEGDKLEGKGATSIFTRNMVEGLTTGRADQDGDGFVSLNELYDYIYDRVMDETPQQRPMKWELGVEGNFLIARNPIPSAKPASLPASLQEAVESRFSTVREQAVEELGHLLTGKNRPLAELARATLERLKDDDSRRVSEAASRCLAGLPEEPVTRPAPPAETVPTAGEQMAPSPPPQAKQSPLAEVARAALERLKDEDARRMYEAAKRRLAGAQEEPAPAPAALPTPPPPQPRPSAETKWQRSLRYDLLLADTQVRAILRAQAQFVKPPTTGDVFLVALDKLAAAPMGSAPQSWLRSYQEVVAGFGIKTEKTRVQDFLAAPGVVLLAAICAAAREGMPLQGVRSSEESCALFAKLLRTTWSGEGEVLMTVACLGAGTRIEASTRIPGVIYDYGKSNRKLDSLFRSIQSLCNSLGGAPGSLPVAPPADAARFCASCKAPAAPSDKFCMKCGMRLPS